MSIPILSVYDENGNEIPIPAIRGQKGDTGNTGAAGPQGPKGDSGENGQDGYTPVRGVDYWTSGDKTEIIESVLEEIHQGADLGLQIVTQLNQPANPADNMIWVETETAMPVGKYIVSSQQPTAGLVNGFLWFREMYLPLAEITLPGSHVSMSIAQVWQYVNGAWVWKAGHVYKAADEEWKDTGVYWFKSGTGFNMDVFGAVHISDQSKISVYTGNEYINFSNGNAHFQAQTGQSSGKFKYLIVDAAITPAETGMAYLMFGAAAVADAASGSFLIKQNLAPGTRTEAVIDISSANVSFVPKCELYQNQTAGAGKIYNIWLV